MTRMHLLLPVTSSVLHEVILSAASITRRWLRTRLVNQATGASSSRRWLCRRCPLCSRCPIVSAAVLNGLRPQLAAPTDFESRIARIKNDNLTIFGSAQLDMIGRRAHVCAGFASRLRTPWLKPTLAMASHSDKRRRIAGAANSSEQQNSTSIAAANVTESSNTKTPAIGALHSHAAFAVPGLALTDHFVTVPLRHGSADITETLDIFVREVVQTAQAPNRARLPVLLYLQGAERACPRQHDRPPDACTADTLVISHAPEAPVDSCCCRHLHHHMLAVWQRCRRSC